MQVEEEMLSAFVLPAKADRYKELLATKKGRLKVVGELDHFRDLDPRSCRKIADRGTYVTILGRLADLGAPDVCHVISSNPEIDGRDMPLREALQVTVGSRFGTFISCVPGRLAYYESEEPNERYLCHRQL
jgi:hypothetical protein